MLGKYLADNEISQEELARRIGKSWRSVSQWCTGKSVPKVDAVILIAKALRLSINEVCELLGFDTSDIPN